MKYLLYLLMLTISAQMKAQVPQKMSYQAVIRDVNNNLLSSRNIRVRISIMNTELESSAVYIETHTGKTNLNGLVSLQIGTGDIMIGEFKKIDWSNGPYFVKTETDPDGGFDFRITGTSELLSVPYALYALNNNVNNTATFDTTSLHTRIVNLQIQAAENKENIEKNIDSIKANAAQSEINILGIKENAAQSAINILGIKANAVQSEINIIGIKENAAQSEINILGIKANAAQSEINILGIKANAAQIAINLDSIRANSVKIKNNIDTINTKIDILDLIAILSSYQRVGKILNAFTVDTIDSINIKSNGNLHSSKNIALSGNIESLGINSSIGTIEKPFKDLYISSNSLYIASDAIGQNIPPTILSNLNGNLEISSGGFKLLGANAAFIAPKFEGRLIGNANTATKLEIARTINGVPFDGSSDIIITSTSNNNLTGIVTSIGNATSIADGTISNSMLVNTSVRNLIGTNTGDETTSSLNTKLGITTLTGSNTGDESATSIKTKLGITALSGSNTGDQDLPTLLSLGAVANNSAITGATKTKLTYDAKGLVTAGTDATTADITASSNKNYVTDVQAGVISNTSGTNTGDETISSLNTKLGITTLTGTNTGDETITSLNTKLGITTLTGSNTGDETITSLNTKLGITTLTGSNTGDQDLPTLLSLGALATNTAITGATKTKLTYDEKGLVTAGTDATTADIAASSNKNYVTDVQAGVISNTSGTNTGDETISSLNTKLGITTLTGTNTGDESATTIKTKLGITTLTGSNTGDQVLPTLLSLGAVANNSAITGATKTKLTYDEKGLVTSGTDATTADIAASSNKNYVTDVQAGVISNTSGSNTGDESVTTIKTKLGITTLTGTNTGDETTSSLNTKLGITILTGSNTGDENATTIKTKLGITTLTGLNTGDQVLPTLLSLGAVATNTAITGATKTKLTYDEKGLVTSGTDATTADIAASSNKNYVTDVQAGVISNTSGTNTGDETITSLSTKLGITTLTGSNTGDENATTIKTKLGITTLTGSNTGDESATTIKTKLGITTLTGSNTGDETLTSLINLGVSPKEGSESLTTTGLLSILTLSSQIYKPIIINPKESKNSIYKLGKGEYTLGVGNEGQVIYILPWGNGISYSEIIINVENGAIWDSEKKLDSINASAIIWTPFSSRSSTMATAIFTDGNWYITGGSLK